MSTYNRVVAADETASLAPTVRARLATEMADPATEVGASLSGTFARGSQLPSGRRRVAFIGDSITAGGGTYSATISDTVEDSQTPALYAALGSSRRSWDLIINAGVGGNTSDQILSRIPTDITPNPVDICVILSATWNDIGQEFSLATSITNVTASIDELLAAGILPVLCTPTPDGISDGTTARKVAMEQRRRAFTDLAESYNLPIVDVFIPVANVETGGLAAAYLGPASDVHPNTAGRKLIGEAVAAVLDRICVGSTPGGISYAGDSADILDGSGFFVVDSDSDGLGDGWSAASGTGVASIYTDPVLGKMQRFTMTSDSKAVAAFGKSVTAGHMLEVSGYISKTGTSKAQISINSSGGNRRITVDGAGPDVLRGGFCVRWVVPSGVTSVNYYFSSGTGTGTVDFGRLAMRDLTALGIA